MKQRSGRSAAATLTPEVAAAPPATPPWERPGLGALSDAGRILQAHAEIRRNLEAGPAFAADPLIAATTSQRTPQDVGLAQQQYLWGARLLKAGRSAEAIPFLRKAILANADHADAHHALGTALILTGQFTEAQQVLSRAVALRPQSALARKDLAVALDRQNHALEAIEAYQRAVQLSPKLADVHRRIGELYVMLNRFEEASAAFLRAADALRDNTESRMHRTNALMLRGDVAEAEKWARKAVALEPRNGDAHSGLAGVLFIQGRFDEANTHYDAALRHNPKSTTSWYGIAQTRRFSEADRPTLDRMHAALARNDLPDAERINVHFSIGKVEDDLRHYAEAMRHFDEGNLLRARELNFDRAAFAATVDQQIAECTPDYFARHAEFGTSDPTPLLIVGMPRSGTTLVEQIVSSHPEVEAGDELTVFTTLAVEKHARSTEFTPERARSMASQYLAVLRRIGPSAARVTDKLPFNLLRLGAIHVILPQARIIHCRRHPIDTCLSIYMTLFKSRMEFAASKSDLAFCYQQYLRLMDHWRTVLPADRFIDVEYERLIADREAETRRLIAFTGLAWDESCLRPEQNDRTIKTASAWQARQPVYASSVARWRRYEPWIGELRQLLPDENDDRA